MSRPAWARALSPERVAAVLILAVLPTLLLIGSRNRSATFDEPFHLTAGYLYLTEGELRFSPGGHPPLWDAAAAVPLLLAAPDYEHDESWRRADEWTFGFRFLNEWNQPRTLLFLGRLPGVFLMMVFAASVYLVSRRWFGATGGLLSLLLFVFDPNLIAHGALITTDVPFAAAFFAAHVAAGAVLLRLTTGRALALAACVALACNVKLSAALLVPSLGALALIRILHGSPWPLSVGSLRRDLEGRGQKLLAALAVVALVVVSTWVAIWAVHGFRYAGLEAGQPLPERWSEIERGGEGADGLIAGLAARRVFPEAYLQHAHYLVHARDGSTQNFYLLGERSGEGWPSYFAWVFLLKTPLATLLLVGALGWGLARRWGQGPPLLEEALWVVPLLVYAGATLVYTLNLGVRHLLPVYPLLYVGLGRLAVWAERRRPRALLAGAAAFLVSTTVLALPTPIAYFNQLGGEPRRAAGLLADSNLDWGQDLRRVGDACRERKVQTLALAYFGTADPRRDVVEPAGVRVLDLRRGKAIPPEGVDLYAISVNFLVGLYLPPEQAERYALFWDAWQRGSAPAGERTLVHVGEAGPSIQLFALR